MRRLTRILIASAMACSVGCRRNEGGEKTGPAATGDVLVRCHFVGMAALAGNTNGAVFKQICALPETSRFAEQTLQKLAHSPRVLCGEQITPAQDERGAALLRPLLDDLLRHESFLQVRGPADKTAEWTLLVQLPADRLKVWRASLAELIQLWKVGPAATNMVEGFTGWQVKRADEPALVRWVEAGQWLALGVGGNRLPDLDEAARRIKASGRPVAIASNYWLETELNLPRLSVALDLPAAIQWPRAKCSVIGQGEDLRSMARMIFAEPVTGPLEPWKIPTNMINDPLISFTAARGVSPWLNNCALLQRLELSPVPNELFFWAQGQLTFQSFLTFPLKEAAGKLERAGDLAPSLLSTNWKSRGMAQIGWRTNSHQVLWSLPYITPFLKPAEFNGTEYVLGGLFPLAPGTNPPPPQLLAQLANQPKLVYYDWEITEARLMSWRIMAQLFAMIADKPQFTTNTAGLPWMMAVEPKLGNTVTQVTAESPSEWSLVRKSYLGFTGLELTALTRWLESARFPKLSFDLPPERPLTNASKPAAPGARTRTAAAPPSPGR